jgi:hypothetical protein
MAEQMHDARALFDDAIGWLREHYDDFEFWVERDLVWTIQSRLRKIIRERGRPYAVFNDYPMSPDPDVLTAPTLRSAAPGHCVRGS